jgi:glycosyltransferase involved in cell wall biosynthesis
LRILMLAQFYPPIIGGEERHVRNLSLALAHRGHDVTVATLASPDAPSVELDDGVEIHRLPGAMQRASALFSDSERRHAPPFPDPELSFALNALIARKQLDVAHAHNWMLHSFLPLKRKNGPRLLVTLHDYSLVCAVKSLMNRGAICDGPALAKCLGCASEHYGVPKGVVTTLALAASGAAETLAVDKFLAVSRAVARGNGLSHRRVPHEVVPNFIPDDLSALGARHDPRLDQLPEDFILFVGDLTRLKGLHVLLEAYSKLDDAPALVLIGRKCPDTPQRLPDNVCLFESWPHDSVMHAWQKCLFGLAPSIWPEPCATVVMEAMCLGKPMIASDIGGMPDLISNGESGLLVTSNDANALAAAMRGLIGSPSLRRELSLGALRKVEAFKAGAVVPRIEQIYENLLAPRAQLSYQLQETVS